jgi:hypothetical protein
MHQTETKASAQPPDREGDTPFGAHGTPGPDAFTTRFHRSFWQSPSGSIKLGVNDDTARLFVSLR